MNLNNLPVLVQSNGEPVVLASKAISLHRLEPSCPNIESRIACHYSSLNESNCNNGLVKSFSKQKFAEEFDQSDFSNIGQSGTCMSEPENQRSGKMSNLFFNESCLKKFQSCFAVVRKDSSLSFQNDAFQFGSSSTLPGVVELDDYFIEPIHRKEAFANRVSRFWNASFQLSDSQQHVKFVEYCNHFLLQMRKFICKLGKAINDENRYLEEINEHKSQISIIKANENNANECFNGSNFNLNSNGDDNDNQNVDYDNLSNKVLLKPPIKLGKVYSELQMHFKTWSDILENLNASRLEIDSRKLKYLTGIQRKIEKYQMEILILTEKLISCRLLNFSCFVSFHSKIDASSDKQWDFILGSGFVKHLSKLIETYNKLLRQQHGISLKETTVSFRDKISPSHSAFYKDSKDRSTLSAFDIPRILSLLAEPAKHELACSLLNILSVFQNDPEEESSAYEREMLGRNPFNHYQFDWSAANHFELDEDNVITHVAGYEVHNASTSPLSNDSVSAIKQLLYAQGGFIVWFMNCLAANTSLLRSNILSKSPRSVVSSQAFTEDTSVVSSDDEASSVTSSVILGQRGSGTHRKRKTVLWRDSWDQEAVKSSSKSYVASIVTQGPVQTLLSRAVDPSAIKSSSASSSPPAPAWFRPRFWPDEKVLIVDASVLNMLTMEVLPDDLLERLLDATQSFVVEKALERWDNLMCLALGTSTNDKCGSLPIEGYPSITKTAWVYIKALRTLMFITERFSKREDVIENIFPRLQTTLDSFHRWCHSKIQQFVANWKLRELMQVTLGDLSQITQLALKCLPLIEMCHNFVEGKRALLPGTLQLATMHLRNIDSVITNMQSLSGHCIKSYTKKCAHLSRTSVEGKFPSSKSWRQKNLADHSSANPYMEFVVTKVLTPICSAVSSLKPRSQLATVSPAVGTILDAVVQIILERRIMFSIQGALQLQRDFEYVIDYVCSDEAGLCDEVRRAAPNFTSFSRASWVVNTLQRTDPLVSSEPVRTGYQRSRRRVHARSVTHDDVIGGTDDNDWTLKEKEFLELRAHVRRRNKRWFTLPCSDNAVE